MNKRRSSKIWRNKKFITFACNTTQGFPLTVISSWPPCEKEANFLLSQKLKTYLISYNKKDFSLASTYYEKALTIREQVYGPDHPKTKNTNTRYIQVQQMMSRQPT
jgi:hypothetical protein